METKPLDTIEQLFNIAVQSKNSPQDWNVGSHFANIANNTSTIPTLTKSNLKYLKAGDLVRYRGMIQDSFDPEYFQAITATVNTTTGEKRLLCSKYRDMLPTIPTGYRVEENHISQRSTASRQPLFCVPIPGENTWARQEYAMTAKPTNQSVRSDSKRLREVDGDGNSNEGNDGNEDAMEIDLDQGEAAPTKKHSSSSSNGNSSSSSSSSDNNNTSNGTHGTVTVQFPLGDQEKDFACLVKMYDVDGGDDSLQFPVNGMFDFIGVLSVDTELTEFNGKGKNEGGTAICVDDAFMSEYIAHNPPASMVPRLHCLCFRPVPPQSPVLPTGPFRSALPNSTSTTTTPIVPFPDTSLTSTSLIQQLQSTGSFEQTRTWIVELLASALGGDRLAGEYMLLNMISRVHSRMDATPLGGVSLGISHLGTSNVADVTTAVNTLTSLVSQLTTNSATLHLSIELLNSRKFSPAKDYTRNRLSSGPLQLPVGTHLLLNESALTAGKLNDNGCRNLRALQQLVLDQTVTYDFEYSTADWPVDVPTTVLSNGPPMIKCKLQLPLHPIYTDGLSGNTATQTQSNISSSASNSLPKARALIAGSRFLTFKLDSQGSSIVETYFVQARQTNNQIKPQDLHDWITHARLLALSYGETTLTQERWNQARAMEGERLQRIKTVTPPTAPVGGPPPVGFGVVNGNAKNRTVAPQPDIEL